MTITRRDLLFGVAAATATACSEDPLIWEKSPKSDTPLFRFTRGGRAGYIDAAGRIVIAPTLHQAGNFGDDDFHDGLARVLLGPGEPWYIDTKGRPLFRARNSWTFSEGLAIIDRNRKSGYIDRAGRIVIDPVFEGAGSFSEGLARARQRGKWGYIGKHGQFSIEPMFVMNYPFSEGVARVIDEGPCTIPGEYGCDLLNPPMVVGEPPGLSMEKRREMTATAPRCRYHYIDRSGKRIFSQSLAGAKDFSEGLAPVSDGRLWGYIDRKGSVVVPFQYERAEPFTEGLARVRSSDRKWGFIDRRGNRVIPPAYYQAHPFANGLSLVSDRLNPCFFIDHSGRKAFAATFNHPTSFVVGLAHCSRVFPASWGTCAYIDRQGRTVFQYAAT